MLAGRLDGKIALITGAAQGIGAATARRFAAEGATVVLTDVLESVRDTAEAIGGDASFRIVDVQEFDQVRSAIDSTVAEHGGLDILMNNAGITRGGLIADFDLADWDLLMRVNVRSVFYGCKAALPHLQRRGGGSIINVASIAGLRGEFFCAAYCASKAAIVNFSRALALDHADEHIRVNVICPGSVDTKANAFLMAREEVVEEWLKTIPSERFGQADEIAGLAAYIASDEASYMVGQALSMDGGTSARMAQPDWKRLTREAAERTRAA